ncbi:MAG: nicotinamide mononucleotide transporter [Ruminococcaceae bacterium]|nr:nicotinamide mononucleotide transporter [Oscillospiraceae bacterium]
MLKYLKNYFTKIEKILWCSSVALIVISFFVFGGGSILTLAASLIGVTSLIFGAKGNPLGQLLIILFSVLYGIISFSSRYYGEMITYLGMTAPMAVFALISWLKNPYNGNKSEVEIRRLKKNEIPVIVLLTAAVTVIFYFILKAFGTSNLLPSTISVTTSFAAVYLSLKRSAYFAAAYAANDIVLIVLWVLSAIEDISYLSVVICFIVFLVNDIYGFINWHKMRKRQENSK